jgi:hypothetical protein
MSGWSGDNNIVATRLRFFDGASGSGTNLGTFTLDRGDTRRIFGMLGQWARLELRASA